MFFGKKEEVDFDTIETLIGENTYFEGNITSKGAIRIEGNIQGNITTEGDLVVGSKGVVVGNVYVNNLLVAGQITGDAVASGKAEITESGNILGNINVQSLVVDEGAKFEGYCSMAKNIENNNK